MRGGARPAQPLARERGLPFPRDAGARPAGGDARRAPGHHDDREQHAPVGGGAVPPLLLVPARAVRHRRRGHARAQPARSRAWPSTSTTTRRGRRRSRRTISPGTAPATRCTSPTRARARSTCAPTACAPSSGLAGRYQPRAIRIAEDGDYGPQTGARIGQSPQDGLAAVPPCARDDAGVPEDAGGQRQPRSGRGAGLPTTRRRPTTAAGAEGARPTVAARTAGARTGSAPRAAAPAGAGSGAGGLAALALLAAAGVRPRRRRR
ncbi:MAG: hypothetical protein M0C28_07910 [Candidatus Moduliflexus flocculans]|nr:hypothetical protein [Candidatus Moduliflexus flocculans]